MEFCSYNRIWEGYIRYINTSDSVFYRSCDRVVVCDNRKFR